jgi:hypothetical protein
MRYPKRYPKRMFDPRRSAYCRVREWGSLRLRKGQEGAAFAGWAGLRANEGVSATGLWPQPSVRRSLPLTPSFVVVASTRLLLIRGPRRTASADVS